MKLTMKNTVKDMVAHCKAEGITGYSGLGKANLLKFIETGVKPAPKPGTVAGMRAACKERGLKGASTLNKAGLVFLLEVGVKPGLANNTYKLGTVQYLQQFCRENGIKGHSGKRKAALIDHMLDNGYLVDAKGGIHRQVQQPLTARAIKAAAATNEVQVATAA